MTTENNVAAQAGDFDPAPKYEYSPDGKTVTWTNRDRMPKVAAQAGDEPMRVAPVRRTENGFVVHHRLEELVRVYGTLHVRAQKRRDVMAEIYEIAAAQVSPRATADVERDAARYRFLRQEHWSNGSFCVVRDPKKSVKLGMDCPSHELLDNAIDAFLATTKPGA